MRSVYKAEEGGHFTRLIVYVYYTPTQANCIVTHVIALLLKSNPHLKPVKISVVKIHL